jgi:ABC-type multidrug transport system fused ATPase/permease subunit
VINEEEPTSVVPTTPRSSQTKPELEGAIEFKNVCFSYPTKPDCQILNNMTFSIAKHEHVAFVGETG